MNTPLFSLQCSRLPAEKSSVCTGLGTHAAQLTSARAQLYIPKRNKFIPKRNKLTFLSATFYIPKRDGHAHTYTMPRIHPGLGCLALMRSATSAMHNIIASEQSGVEWACACALRVVQNGVSHI